VEHPAHRGLHVKAPGPIVDRASTWSGWCARTTKASVPDLCPMPHRCLLLLPAFLVLHATAQTWELVTPVKTRSDLAAVHLHSPTEAITIDRTLGYVLRTTDAGDSWDRMPFNMIDVPRSLVMFDDQRGIIGADIGRFHRTTDNWNSFTTVILSGFGHAACLSFASDTLGWAASESGKIARTTDGGRQRDRQHALQRGGGQLPVPRRGGVVGDPARGRGSCRTPLIS